MKVENEKKGASQVRNDLQCNIKKNKTHPSVHNAPTKARMYIKEQRKGKNVYAMSI